MDLTTGKCYTKNHKSVTLNNLVSQLAFSHPILTEPSILSTTKTFHHRYQTIEELFLSASYVYSTLLRAKDPSTYQFKIGPSPKFQSGKNKDTRRIYISINAKKEAEESLTISQLETLISDLSGHKFEFIDGILINEEFSIKNLPETINGDFLYTTDELVLNLLNNTMDLSPYELRYISPRIGFGLFAREPIKQNELSFIYAGTKEIQDDSKTKYAFQHEIDSLNMYLDARQYGNIARFINHAPNPKVKTPLLPQESLVEANLKFTYHNINGIEVIVFTAIRDIEKGEQLLIDYGKKFFRTTPVCQFKSNGKVLNDKKKWLKRDSQSKLRNYRIMATHGIKKAQQYILLRTLIISVSIIILMNILMKS